MDEKIMFVEDAKTVASETGVVVESTKKTFQESAKTSKKSSKKSNDYQTIGPDVKETQISEISRMVEDPRYHLLSIPGTVNAVMNLTSAYNEGIEIYRMKNNRIHGNDMGRTGASIMNYGSQVALVVMTVVEAKAAGVEYERFPSDPHKDEQLKDDALVLLEGHGRVEYILSQDKEKWPVLLATFPAPDCKGEIHIEKAFLETNQNDSVWGSKDFIITRLADPKCHDGWKFLKTCEKDNVSWTVGCIFATGDQSSITKRSILNPNSDLDEMFSNLEYGKLIYEAAKKAFGVDKSSALGTKAIPLKIFSIWKSIQKGKTDIQGATDLIEEFLGSLSVGEVSDINSAKSSGDKDRDTVRKEKLTKLFEDFKVMKGI